MSKKAAQEYNSVCMPISAFPKLYVRKGVKKAKASTRVAILLRPYKAVCLASFDMSDRANVF
jgi:hypothetical protein